MKKVAHRQDAPHAPRLPRVVAAFALAFAFLSPSASHAGPPPGTVIPNTASSNYTLSATPFTVTSNTVQITTGAVGGVGYSAMLTASGNVLSTPGATVNFPHVLTNTGTVPDTYNLAAINQGPSFLFTSIRLLPDVNGDGVPDSATPIAPTVALAPAAVFRFVVQVSVPGVAAAGTSGNARVTAVSVGNAATLANTDRVAMPGGSGGGDCATAAKTLSIDRGPSPGGPVTVTLVYDACDKARQKVMLSDTLPAGMRYVANSGRWASQPSIVLTDANANDAQGTGATTINYDFGVTAANTVTGTINNLPAGTKGSFTFQVDIESGLAINTAINNTASYVFWDASGNRGTTSNTNTATFIVTGTADLELIGQTLPTVSPGATAVFTNVLTNRGSDTDTFEISLAGSTFPSGTVFTLFKSDGVTPLADTNGNGTPDTGPVASNGKYNIIVRALIPTTAAPGAYKITKTARSARAPARSASADDAVDTIATRCSLTLEPDNQALAGFGAHVTYFHTMTNRGNCNENVTASISYLGNSRPGWRSAAFVDNASSAGGSIPGVLDPTDTPVTPGWTTMLAPGQSLRMLVDVLAPTQEEMRAAAAKSKGAKAIVDSNVTTLKLDGASTSALTVRDTTSLDDNKSDGPDTENTIRNYTTSTYEVATAWAVIGRDAWLRANAPACNAVADVVEQRLVVITGPNGEREEVTATETGANTGVFTVAAMPVRLPPVVAGDRILQGAAGTVFTMDVQGCSRAISGVMTVLAPVSVVFDSRTNEPVAGAAVTLVNANGSSCGTAPVGGPVTTGADGRFSLVAANAGDFCLRVTAPNGYTFPSTVPYTNLNGGRNLVVSGPTSGGSYGTPFRQSAAGVVVVDVPVDAGSQDGLFVQKVANVAIVELGEFVDYAVRVRNNTGNVLDRASVTLVDDLPAGFAYVNGTARRDGNPIADPVSAGPRLTLSLGNMIRGQQIVITYRVRVGPGAMQGDGVNRVQAAYITSGASTVSNIATARVQVIGGVFSDRGFILGKVFMDCNANGVQDKGEAGMPGVRLLIEDGTFIMTDGEGRYSFYGITNRTHILKLDRSTLPTGTKLVATGQRNLGDAGSRVVDLKAGMLYRGDFAIQGCDPALVEEANARAKALAAEDPLATLAGAQLSTEARIVTDPKALPASGLVTLAAQPGSSVSGGPALDASAGATQAGAYGSLQTVPGAMRPTPAPRVLPDSREAVALPPLETLVPDLDNKLGFIGLKDGDTLAQAQATIRVKGTAGAVFKLTVNGAEVSDKRVGKRSTLAEKQVQAWEYVGVEMKPGVNELTIAMIDSFGNARGAETIRVRAPGKLGKIVIELPAGGGIADGRTAAKVVVKVYDVDGVPVTTRTPITISASRGLFQVVDPDPNEPGIQAMVEGGRGEFPLASPMEPGSSTILVSSGGLRAEARLDFLPELRSLVAAGVVEGIVNFRNGAKGILPTRAGDPFEQELKTLSREFSDGKGAMGARAAFFLKGKIKGDMLLTAAYDSDKDSRERLFRDIQPDEFYPVYGDSAVRGFDAQSTSKLYVRIDKNRSYLLWGDFTTQSESQVRKLSSYSRSLTGIKQHFETDRVSANVFASRDTSRQAIEELRANGTSGPYQLGSAGALINSEKIEIIVRDRNQPSIVLSSLPQSRFSDYEIDALTGRILFKGPVASVDRDLNPVLIRVTYEVDQGGPEFWVGGAEAQVKVTDRIEVGGVFVKDNNPQAPFKMGGANVTVKLGDNTYVMGEVARTETGLDEKKGDAGRIEITHESKNIKGQAFVAHTDKEFDNPGAYLSQGRGEAGGRLEYKVREGTTVRAEALRTEDLVTQSVRDGAMVAVTQQIGEKLAIEVGVRHAAEHGVASPVPQVQGQPAPQPLPDEVTTVRARLTGQVPGFPNATVYGEAEVDVQDADRRVLAAGGEYQLPNKGRLYARHEFISSITGPYGLNATERQNTTAVGVDMDYMKDGRLFSEYRIRDALSGGDTEAAFGLKNLWTLAPGLRLGTSFERVHSISGTGQNENTALALGLEYTANPVWKGSTRLEVRDAATQQSLLSTVGFAAKINRDWTALVRNAYSLTRNKDNDGEHTIERLQGGLAYRDTETNRWNALARVEHRLEDDDSQAGVSLKKTTEIVSINADWQPIRPFVVSGRYAAKWTNDKSNGLSTKYRAQVVGARATWEFAPKWDVGLVTSAMFGDSTASRQYGVGLELGYQAFTNLWVSAGYNFFGYRDDDLAGADHTAKGPFIRVRYKFDETLLESAPAERKAP